MAKPQVFYFPIRGRGEPIKLALAAKGIDFDVVDVDYPEMKSDLTKYKFAQCPRYVDEDADISQSNAIMRHIGRKHGMYGSGLAEAAAVDMLLDGIEDLKRKYLVLIYTDQLAEGAKKVYWETHCDPASVGGRNGGAHFTYLCSLMAGCASPDGWAVSKELSVGDLLLFDLVDSHIHAYADQFTAQFPELAAHHAKVAAIPGVKAYLKSPLRLPKANNNGLG